MGSLAIVGLQCDATGALDTDAIERLQSADTVVVADAAGAAVLDSASGGIPYVSLAELGLGPSPSAETVIGHLVRLAQTGEVVLVTSLTGRAGSSGTTVFVPSRVVQPGAPSVTFDDLMRLVALLRSPEGCPWDRAQTHESLGASLIEEAYETLAAIESGDRQELAEELGDLLLQVALHAEIGAGEGTFTIDDVLAHITEKIVRRHPHVFGAASAETAADVTRVWDAVKREEKPHAGVLGGVPGALPALMRAQKISRRAASAGFEWENIDGVWAKVAEEIAELKACEPGSPECASELGDVLFTMVNVARKMGIDAESALRDTCERFTRRFIDMERNAASGETPLHGLEPDEWDDLWKRAKARERAERARDDE